MGKAIKRLGDYLISCVNLDVRRKVNGMTVVVPVICGVKVGVRSEPWMSGVLRELLPVMEGMFYDVGVNLGQTLIKVKTIDPERKYVGFEPNPSCVFYLGKLLGKNLWPEVYIVPACLSDMDGLLKLRVASDTDAGASVVEGLRSEDKYKGVKIVPAFRYSSIEDALPDGHVGVIKIDVEGAEPEVLDTLAPIIMRDRPVLIMEILPVRGEGDTFRLERRNNLLSQLQRLGYSPLRIMKSPSDSYTGLAVVDNNEYDDDIVMKDYVVVPNENRERLLKTLSVVS